MEAMAVELTVCGVCWVVGWETKREGEYECECEGGASCCLRREMWRFPSFQEARTGACLAMFKVQMADTREPGNPSFLSPLRVSR
jgi:hypothetical protein